SLNPTHTTGTVTVNVSGGTIPTVDSSWTSNGSGNYTKGNATTQINASAIINVTGLVAGSSVRVFSTGSSTIIASDENSATTEQFTVNAAAVDITVLKAGQIPFRITNVSTSSGTVNIQPNQTEDRAYAASSGLAFGSSCTIDTSAKTFAITTKTTVQNFYSFMVESFLSQTTLRNVNFPLSTFGEASYSLNSDYEFTSSSLQHLHNDGFRYVTTAGAVKQIYCAVLSQGVTAGLQPKYVQTQGGTVVSTINTGNVGQVIKIFGDSNNGNIDYRGHLVFKVQANGYRQAEVDVVSTYGTLGANLYVIGLTTIPLAGFTTGNPNLSNVTVTDNTSSPVSFNVGNGAKNYSYTITDGGSNSGDTLLRYFNYHLSQSATFEGFPPFQWPELLSGSGAS
ncbi:MAG: hypothetical protein GY928_30715, partial [Colwellia sp.]|nr:hypothetical protein [Colwellia sp.]